MFKENVLSGLSWLPLISRIGWAKNPRDPRDVAPQKCPKKVSKIRQKSWFSENGIALCAVIKLTEPASETKSTAILPYIKGVSEALRRCLQQQGVRTIFKSETIIRSHLVRPKDTVDPNKQDGVSL